MSQAEEYPSLAEGIGLENRQGCQSPRGFESLFLLHLNIKINSILALKSRYCFLILKANNVGYSENNVE